MAGKADRSGRKPEELQREMRLLDHVHGLDAYRRLVDLMRGSEDENIQMQSAKIILEHARGKPKQSVEVSGGFALDLVGVIDQAHEAAMRKVTKRP